MNRSVMEEEMDAAGQTGSSYYRDLLTARPEEGGRAEQLVSVIENFQELMKCFMCLSKVKEPVLCPSCSKFACEACLRSWIIDRKPECPVCRRPLALSQVVRVRFLNEFSRIIDVLGKSQLPVAEGAGEGAEQCAEHSSPMGYYCLTCTRPVCSDCVVMTKRHDGHAVERIKAVYERKLEAICAELAAIGQRAGEHRGYARELAQRLEQLRKAKEEKIDELMNSYRLMKTRLDNDFAARSQRILEEKRRAEEAAEGVEALTADVYNQIRASAAACTIAKADDYLRLLAELGERAPAPPLPGSVVAEFGREVSVRPAEGLFVLAHYSRHRAANEIVFSEPLMADGVVWRVKVYPNGTGIYKGMYLSLFVEMVKGWEGGGAFHYKVALVKPGAEGESVERDYTSDFENSICWGYNRFCKLEDLETRGFLDRERDEITLRYSIRAANHFQKLRDQSCYIRHLEEQLRREREAGRRRERAAGRPEPENPFCAAGAEGDAEAGGLSLLMSERDATGRPPPERAGDRSPPDSQPGSAEDSKSGDNSLIRISDVNEDPQDDLPQED